MSKFNMVSLAQHNALRLKYAEELLIEYQKLNRELNTVFPCDGNHTTIGKLSKLADKAYSFIH